MFDGPVKRPGGGGGKNTFPAKSLWKAIANGKRIWLD